MQRNNTYAVILAGGVGTRFWPKSRVAQPKQFMQLTSEGSLLQATIKRLRASYPSSRIYIVTGAQYKRLVGKQCKPFNIPAANILLEPSGKNTAPSVCWAAAVIHKRDPQATLAVLPSDHLISKPKKFNQLLAKAFKEAQYSSLVTFGIVPTRPETGYGYLKTSMVKRGGRPICKVVRFTEKPSLKVAKGFIKKNKYFWNSGMFVWRSEVILSEFKTHAPRIYNKLKNAPTNRSVKKVWSELPSISVDYAILEKSKNVVAVKARDIGWSDLGSWVSLLDVSQTDNRGNLLKGDILSLKNRRSLLWSDHRLVVGIGLENLAVIDTPDALLVCHLDQSQAVREAVDQLKKKKKKEYFDFK